MTGQTLSKEELKKLDILADELIEKGYAKEIPGRIWQIIDQNSKFVCKHDVAIHFLNSLGMGPKRYHWSDGTAASQSIGQI